MCCAFCRWLVPAASFLERGEFVAVFDSPF